MKRQFKFVILLLLTACASNPDPPTSTFSQTKETKADMPKIRYLALGDSYTIGESVDESERWPIQMANLLDRQGYPTEVTIIARTGWTTEELWQGIQAHEIDPPYDMVSLLIGVNNQYRGRDIEEYREQFVFLLNKSIEYAGGDSNHVFVVSIPDWGVTPFAEGRDRDQIGMEIDQFNSVNREETIKLGSTHVDITPGSREAINEPSLIAVDGLHPSGKMYAQWAEQVLPIALKIVEDRKGD